MNTLRINPRDIETGYAIASKPIVDFLMNAMESLGYVYPSIVVNSDDESTLLIPGQINLLKAAQLLCKAGNENFQEIEVLVAGEDEKVYLALLMASVADAGDNLR